MEKYFVGQRAPTEWGIPQQYSGGHLEATTGGFFIVLGLPRMEKEEKEDLRTGKIAVRIIEEDGMLLTLIRFGSSSLIFELPFDPIRYKDNRVAKLKGTVNTVQIFGLDTDTVPATIQVLRFVTIPRKLLDRWYGSWDRAALMAGFSARYSEWLNRLFSYTTLQLWEQAIYIGNLGEI